MNDKLQQLGLNKTEIQVYLTILQLGRATPALISRDTGIKRPTVYAAAGELVRLGIVSEDFGGRSKYFVASPNDLEKLVVERKKKIMEEESLVESLLPDLHSLTENAGDPVPRIQYVREEELEEFFYKQTSVWNESMLYTRETSWWGHNSKDLTQHKFVQKWIDDYWKNSPKRLELHLLSPRHTGEEDIEDKNYERRHIKYWNVEQNSSQWIMGDYILMVVTNQSPQYAIQIKDSVMAESLRRTYRELWNKL